MTNDAKTPRKTPSYKKPAAIHTEGAGAPDPKEAERGFAPRKRRGFGGSAPINKEVHHFMKRTVYILFALTAIMLAAVIPITANAAAANLAPARLIVDNLELTGLDSPPVFRNNRVMVPARAIFEHVGGSVSGANNYREITIRYRGDTLVMNVGVEWAQLNGQYIFMEEPPAIINNRTLIPLRFAAQAFGFEVDWDPVHRAAILLSPANGEPGATPTPPPVANTPPPDHVADPTPTPLPGSSHLATDISSAPIQSAPHPTTNILSLLTPRETGAQVYSIVASSAISNVNHFQLDNNRIVVDVYNSISSLVGPFYASGPVHQIASSQFSRDPNVTRVVFHISAPTEFSVSLSYDRRIITVAFASNTISTVMPTSTATTDNLHIQGNFQPSVRISSAGYPRYLTIYVDNSQMAAHGQHMPVGAYATHFVTGQLNGAAYVRVYMRDRWPAISLTHGADSVSILMHGGLNGVTYDFTNRELRLCRNHVFMNINQVQHLDEYLLQRYTVTLPPSANGLGFGTLYVGDNYINSISLQMDAHGNTQVVFDTARVMTFTVHETATEFIIRGHLPWEIFSFIVVIDPGHGGQQPGTAHHGVVEKDLVLTISHMVMEYLNRNPNIRAYMTRHGDTTVLNSWRAEFANEKGADLFVSIHANAVNNRPHVSGIETWFVDHPREAGWSFTSRQFATIMQRNMIRATGAVDRGLMQSQGTRQIIVLRDTYMPAVLLEVGFLTNQAEAALLATNAYQRIIARSIYEGILESFGVLPRR